MVENENYPSGRDMRRGRRGRWLGISYAGVALAAGALLVSACSGGSSGPGVASTGSHASASSSAAAAGGGRAASLAYSRCMRAHGITNFPDPDSNGGISINGKEVDQHSPQYLAANSKCQKLLPAPTAGGVPSDRAAALKYSKCMRAHGVKHFPDPNAQGGIDLNANTLGVNPNGPLFTNANKACQHLMGNGSGPSTQSN